MTISSAATFSASGGAKALKLWLARPSGPCQNVATGDLLPGGMISLSVGPLASRCALP
jgi:hypothetical protein